jgi:hypothetical protein
MSDPESERQLEYEKKRQYLDNMLKNPVDLTAIQFVNTVRNNASRIDIEPLHPNQFPNPGAALEKARDEMLQRLGIAPKTPLGASLPVKPPEHDLSTIHQLIDALYKELGGAKIIAEVERDTFDSSASLEKVTRTVFILSTSLHQVNLIMGALQKAQVSLLHEQDKRNAAGY